MRHHRLIHRITNWLVILGYALVASGVPLPVARWPAVSPGAAAVRQQVEQRLSGKDRTQPFPCMDKPCGCATAEQCFTSCCCNTPAETLAWAKAHAVEPAVLDALERRVAFSRHAVAKTAKTSCCASRAPAAEESCCASRQPATAVIEGDDRCSMAVSLAAVPSTTEELTTEEGFPADDPAEPRSRTVTLRAMLACGGIVAEWFAAVVALPPPRTEVFLAMRVFDVCTPGNESGDSLRASPATPPPRAA